MDTSCKPDLGGLDVDAPGEGGAADVEADGDTRGLLPPEAGVQVLASVGSADDGRGLALARHNHQAVAEALAHQGVRVLHHAVHGAGEVVLLRPRQHEALKVQPEPADLGVSRAHLDVTGAGGAGVRLCVQNKGCPVLESLLSTAHREHAADTEVMSAAPSGNSFNHELFCKKRQHHLPLTSERLALSCRVTSAVCPEAGVAGGVGELDHGEQRQHPGLGRERGD